MTAGRRTGLIGGTFDPVHYGHLDAAEAASRALQLDDVVFVPAHVPPHRSTQPLASAFHRFAMVALAIEGRSGLRVSDAELGRDGPSFTIDTLRAFHQLGIPPAQLFFIVGADAFAEIATWREFPGVLEAASFAVVARPGCRLEDALGSLPAVLRRVRQRPWSLERFDEPGVFPVEAVTRDVSATEVRTRIASGLDISDLVPPPVARHIAAHNLYEPVGDLHG
jgi:nicotinate-nucleotide adenylyltransferase